MVVCEGNLYFFKSSAYQPSKFVFVFHLQQLHSILFPSSSFSYISSKIWYTIYNIHYLHRNSFLVCVVEKAVSSSERNRCRSAKTTSRGVHWRTPLKILSKVGSSPHGGPALSFSDPQSSNKDSYLRISRNVRTPQFDLLDPSIGCAWNPLHTLFHASYEMRTGYGSLEEFRRKNVRARKFDHIPQEYCDLKDIVSSGFW